MVEEKNGNLLLGIVDCMFKAILLDPNNPDYLKCLIHEITSIPLKTLDNIEIRNTEHTINNKNDKRLRSDVIVSIGKMYINIELNREKYNGLFNRNDNYMQEIAYSFYNVKENYLTNYKIIQINFDCFNYLKTKKEISKLVYKEYETNELDPNYECSIKYHVNLDYIKKNCYNKDIKDLSKFERYCLLLMAETKEFACKFAGDDCVMRKVSKRLENLSSDEKMIGLYDAEIEAEKIRSTQIDGAKLEGIEKGKIEGAKEEKIEIAKNMLRKKTDINFISEVTELSIMEIQEL